MKSEVTFVSRSFAGHRQAYVNQFSALATKAHQTPRIVNNWWKTLLAPSPALFLMIEEHSVGYSVSAIVRAITGRRTVGFLFRGREAVDGRSPRLVFKRTLLRVMQKIPFIQTLSIVPFSVEPRLRLISDGWIDDPQLWDIDDTSTPATLLSDEVLEAAAGRRVIVSIGVQSEGKGVAFFTDAWLQDASLRSQWLCVAAGKVAPEVKDAVARFRAAGGFVCDRFISDDELRSLYGAADVIYGVYSPSYDQASGIFGRAVQYDIPILVRRGSAVDINAQELGARASSIDYGDVAALQPALEMALKAQSAHHKERAGIGARNTATILKALGLKS